MRLLTASSLILGSVASYAGAPHGTPISPPHPYAPDFSVLLDSLDFTEIVVAIIALSLALVGLYVVVRGVYHLIQILKN